MISNTVTSAEEARTLLAAQGLGEDEYAFLSALRKTGRLTTPGAVMGFLEKPWNWADEFLAWEQAGRPQDHDDPGWDRFAEATER